MAERLPAEATLMARRVSCRHSIPGARVTVTNAGNASVQTALTDAAGAFLREAGLPASGTSFKLSYRLGF